MHASCIISCISHGNGILHEGGSTLLSKNIYTGGGPLTIMWKNTEPIFFYFMLVEKNALKYLKIKQIFRDTHIMNSSLSNENKNFLISL